MIHFVGAGPGAPDLITVRGQHLLAQADVVIYAGSLVNPLLLEVCKPDCVVYDSSSMTLAQMVDVMAACDAEGKSCVRLHTGDPSLFGAHREQMDELDRRSIAYDVVPGVSSFLGAAATLQTEYTIPGGSQTVILTRMEGRTPVPQAERLSLLAAHGCTMVLFLSMGVLEAAQRDLLAGGCDAQTPAAIVYKATWPDEAIYRCTVGTLAACARENGVTKTALVVIGDCLETHDARSLLYDASFSHGYREAVQPAEGRR